MADEDYNDLDMGFSLYLFSTTTHIYTFCVSSFAFDSYLYELRLVNELEKRNQNTFFPFSFLKIFHGLVAWKLNLRQSFTTYMMYRTSSDWVGFWVFVLFFGSDLVLMVYTFLGKLKFLDWFFFFFGYFVLCEMGMGYIWFQSYWLNAGNVVDACYIY